MRYGFLLSISALMALSACGGHSAFENSMRVSDEAKQKMFKAPTEVLPPTTPQSVKDLNDYSVYRLVEAKFGADVHALSVSATIKIESSAGTEIVDLVGALRADGTSSLVDLNPLPDAKNRLVAEAMCVDVGVCQQIILNVYYNVEGKTKKVQFSSVSLRPEDAAPAAGSVGATPPQTTKEETPAKDDAAVDDAEDELHPTERGLPKETDESDERLGDFVGAPRNEILIGKLWARSKTPELPPVLSRADDPQAGVAAPTVEKPHPTKISEAPTVPGSDTRTLSAPVTPAAKGVPAVQAPAVKGAPAGVPAKTETAKESAEDATTAPSASTAAKAPEAKPTTPPTAKPTPKPSAETQGFISRWWTRVRGWLTPTPKTAKPSADDTKQSGSSAKPADAARPAPSAKPTTGVKPAPSTAGAKPATSQATGAGKPAAGAPKPTSPAAGAAKPAAPQSKPASGAKPNAGAAKPATDVKPAPSAGSAKPVGGSATSQVKPTPQAGSAKPAAGTQSGTTRPPQTPPAAGKPTRPPQPQPPQQPDPTRPKPTPQPAPQKPPRQEKPAPAPTATPTPAPSVAEYPFPPAAPNPTDAELDQRITLLEAKLAPLVNLKDGGIARGGYSDSIGGGIRSSIVNASLLPSNIPGLVPVAINRNAHYGSGMLVSFLENVATYLMRQLGLKLYVGDMSLKNGGSYGRSSNHNTHRNGLDADLAWIGSNAPLRSSALNDRGTVVSGFDYETTWNFLKLAARQELVQDAQKTTAVSRIFMSPAVKVGFCSWAKQNDLFKDDFQAELMRLVRPVAGHHKHFHLSLKCSPHYPLCRNLAGPPPAGTGCK